MSSKFFVSVSSQALGRPSWIRSHGAACVIARVPPGFPSQWRILPKLKDKVASLQAKAGLPDTSCCLEGEGVFLYWMLFLYKSAHIWRGLLKWPDPSLHSSLPIFLKSVLCGFSFSFLEKSSVSCGPDYWELMEPCFLQRPLERCSDKYQAQKKGSLALSG